MSSFKFPGRSVARYVRGARKEIKRLSYRDRNQQGQNDHPVTEASHFRVALEIAIGAKEFREEFGSSDGSEGRFCGYESHDMFKRFRVRSGQIQGELDSLDSQTIAAGGKPLPRQPRALVPPLEPIKDKFTQIPADCTPVPTVKQIRKTPQYTQYKSPAGRSRQRRSIPRTPLSPLPLRLVQLEPSSYSIHTIPTVKYVRDIPFPTGSSSSSGKYVVDYEEDSEDEDVENEDFAAPPAASLQNEKEVGMKQPEEAVVRLNKCPVDTEDIEGFPVIIDGSVPGALPPKPLCFRCGSAGIEQLIFCCSCCEPYHPFCSGDESLLSSYISRILPKGTGVGPCRSDAHSEVREDKDRLALQSKPSIPIGWNRDPILSLLSPPLTPMPLGTPTDLDNMDRAKEVELKNTLRSWTCSRCYVCYVCQRQSLPPPSQGQEVKFLKCPHCPRVVHSACCAGANGKKLSIPSTVTTRVCEECFKCKSCGKRMERRGGGRGKEDNGQVLCLECFRRKQKGSFCPICEVCYADNDYDTKMMECARCQRWIHANCEKITGEEYEILSCLPESVDFICRQCEDPNTVFWRAAIALQFTSGCKEILRIFQTKVTSTWWSRKPRILQPRCDNILRSIPTTSAENKEAPIQIPPSQASPSTKENKGIVRELFKATDADTTEGPQKGAKVQDPSVVLQDCNKTSESPRRRSENTTTHHSLAGETTKTLRIVLHDCRKFPSPTGNTHGEGEAPPEVVMGTGNALNANQPPPTPPSVPNGPADFKTPTKNLIPLPLSSPIKSPLETPIKRMNTITEIVISKLTSGLTSVKSVYSHTRQFINSLGEEDDPATKNLTLHFESALKEVFPWFNPEEIEGNKEALGGSAGLVSSVLSPARSNSPGDESRPLAPNEGALLQWNPFETVYWDKTVLEDKRRCSFCQELGDSPGGESGRLLWAGLSEWVHVNCALWSSEVWEEEDGALQEVGVALSRSRALPCAFCGEKGASLNCCFGTCKKSFHFPCALKSFSFLSEEDKGMFCPDHAGTGKGRSQEDMQILRQVFVDTDWLQKKGKSASSTDLIVFIGSCQIECLGHIVPLSVEKVDQAEDGRTMLVPIRYSVSRVFWSAQDTLPSDHAVPEKVTYKVTTGVGKKEARRSNYGRGRGGQVGEVNLVVDHSGPRSQVSRKMGQVRAFQDWAETSDTYVDEHGEEWLYPCTLNFSEEDVDAEAEENDRDADVEDNDAEADDDTTATFTDTNDDDDLLSECLSLTGEEIQRLTSAVEDLDLDYFTGEVDEELLTAFNSTLSEAKKLESILSVGGEVGGHFEDGVKKLSTNIESSLEEAGTAQSSTEEVDSEDEERWEEHWRVGAQKLRVITPEVKKIKLMPLEKATAARVGHQDKGEVKQLLIHIEGPAAEGGQGQSCQILPHVDKMEFVTSEAGPEVKTNEKPSPMESDKMNIMPPERKKIKLMISLATVEEMAEVKVHAKRQVDAPSVEERQGQTTTESDVEVVEFNFVDSDAETIVYSDDEVMKGTRRMASASLKKAGISIPQVDGGGDEDSDSYSSENEGSSSTTSSATSSSASSSSDGSSSSSSDDEEAELGTGARKLPARKVRGVQSKSSSEKTPKKTSTKSGGQRSKSSGGGGVDRKKKGSTATFGGRILRNRKKLNEVKQGSAVKKEEFKCPICQKPFSSQTSVRRHSKWCKPKKGQGAGKGRLRKEETLKVATTVVGPKPPKRGRKPKKVVQEQPLGEGEGGHSSSSPEPQLGVFPDNPPEPSTSGRNAEDLQDKGVKELVKGIMKMDTILTTTGSMERGGFDLRQDGNVYCRRCRNTYRTRSSYDNHLGSCRYFSSDEEEEEEEVPVLDEIPEPPSNDLPPTAHARRAFSPVRFSPVLSDATTIGSDDETSSSATSTSSPPSGGLAEIVPSVPTEPPPQKVSQTQGSSHSLVEHLEGRVTVHEPQGDNLITDDTFHENEPANEAVLVGKFGFGNENQVLEAEEVEEEVVECFSGAAGFNSMEEVPVPPGFVQETMETEAEAEAAGGGEEEYEEEELPQFTPTGAAPSHFIPGPYPLEPPPPQQQALFKNMSPFPGSLSNHQDWMIPFNRSVDQPMGMNQGFMENFQQSQVSELPLVPPHQPMIQHQDFQTFQQQQQQQHFPQQPHFQQIHQSPPTPTLYQHQGQANQQLQQPLQFQTFTLQDPTTGQLVTVQVPVFQQTPPPPPPTSTFPQQLSSFYGQGQAPFLPSSQVQYEHYKQQQFKQEQVQAGIQFQRTPLPNHLSVPVQQQSIYQPQHHHHQSILARQLEQHSSIQHPILVQRETPQASPNGNHPMLVSVSPQLLQTQQQQQQQFDSSPNIHVPAHAQTQMPHTYMVVQQGNSHSLTPVRSNCQHPLELANQEPVSQGIVHAHGLLNPNNLQEGATRVCLRTPTARPCPCVDCVRKSPSMGEKQQRPNWMKRGSTTASTGAIPRKPKTSNKIRDRLTSMMISEGQLSIESSARLQLFKSMISPPTTTLPKLLPATVTVTSTTTTSSTGFKTPGTMSPQSVVSLQGPSPTTSCLSIATTLTSDSLVAPIVSASPAPTQLLKAPTPSPNIAVVRPMEHPLQRISNQIQQLESTFTSPATNSVQGSLDNITGGPVPILASTPVVQPLTLPMAQVTTLSRPTVSTVGNERGERELRRGEADPPEDEKNEEVLKSTPARMEQEQQVPAAEPPPAVQEDKSIKIQLKRQEGGDSYSINKISGSATTNKQFQGMFKTLKIKGKITTGDQAGTSTDVVVHPIVHTIPIPSPDGDEKGESNRTIAEDEPVDNTARTSLETSVELPPSTLEDEIGQPRKNTTMRLTHRAVIVYQVKIEDKVQYQSCDVRAVWGYILERVQGTRRNHNLPPLAYPATNISLPENKHEAAAAASFNRLGLTHRAVQFLLEQLPGVKNAAKEGHVFKFHEPPKTSAEDTPVVENPTGSARSECYKGRKPFDMFGWLASKHRQPPAILDEPSSHSDKIKRGNLPISMRYRNLLKNGTKHLNVYRSEIHGRGIFTSKHIEAGELIIEYAGEVIRNEVTADLREKYYESKGIGCYMFRMTDNSVVDATLKGNAARFINHSCDPNCKAKILDILGTKHILIFAIGRIVAGEELTYDYKFELEDRHKKISCTCGTRKCRKTMN